MASNYMFLRNLTKSPLGRLLKKGFELVLFVISWFDSAHLEASQSSDLIGVSSLHPERSRRVSSCPQLPILAFSTVLRREPVQNAERNLNLPLRHALRVWRGFEPAIHFFQVMDTKYFLTNFCGGRPRKKDANSG